MREIRDWLNEKGIKNTRGGPMTFNVIQHMLSNRRYIGELKYRDVVDAGCDSAHRVRWNFSMMCRRKC